MVRGLLWPQDMTIARFRRLAGLTIAASLLRTWLVPSIAHAQVDVAVHALVQLDARFVGNAAENTPGDGFLIRRARPIVSGTIDHFVDFQIVPDFGQGKVVLFDAYAGIRFSRFVALRVGKFKPQVGLERVQSAADVAFVERGLPTNLVPQRDIGAQLSGAIGGTRLTYAFGVFNGVADLGSADLDNGVSKDLVGRVFTEPFAGGRVTWLRGLGLGFAATTGQQQGTVSNPSLPSYRSPAQVSVFSYRAGGTALGTAVGTGARTRVALQGYWYQGPLGVLGEYIASSQRVRLDTSAASLTHRAWQYEARWVLTGEHASFGSVRPDHPFAPGTSNRGAVEIHGRIGSLRVDRDAFPVFADPGTAVRREREPAAGVTWYLDEHARFLADYESTAFTGGAASGNRPTEHALLTRLQVSF